MVGSVLGMVGSLVGSVEPGPTVLASPVSEVRATPSSPQATSKVGSKARISVRMPAA
jgi:hypothetical protein